jgi:REP element-mobilizing transposase RayT
MSIYHGKDLRKGRYSEPGRPYLVTTVVRNREPLFKNFSLARLVVKELRSTTEQGLVESPAWIVMLDHVHWLLIPKGGTLRSAMQRTKSLSAASINRMLSRDGQVWQKGYFDRALRREENLIEMARYVVANPLRAGLVKSILDYPHWDAAWL